MTGKKGYYRPVPGSKELRTRHEGKEDLFLKIESELEKATAPGTLFEYEDEILGGVLLKGAGVSVPVEVFDALLQKLSPIEQVIYLQLFRLAYGAGKNFCRVGKKELVERTGMSAVRTNAALEGLVKKKLAKPIHRSVRGTLWRVFHPAEAGAEVAYKVEEGNRVRLKVKEARPAKPSAPPKKALEAPGNVDRFAQVGGEKPELPLKKLAEKYFDLKGRKPEPDELDDTLSIITGLLEDGFSRKQAVFAIEWFTQNFPREKDLSRLPYYIARALEEYKGD